MFSANTSQVAAGAGAVNYIEDVFSTWLYTGNGSTQTITNGIDLSTKGGLVWAKSRAAGSHFLYDTTRGVNNYLSSNSADPQTTQANSLTAFNTTGFSIGDALFNDSAVNYASWTFREQPKFFDIVTATRVPGQTNARISHNLGSVPGFVIVKSTDYSSESWRCYHQSLGRGSTIQLNLTDAVVNIANYWGTSDPTSTDFGINWNLFSGDNYVFYFFASNAGGFGLTGTDNVISCGSFTTDASGNASVNLGYEPQWVLEKQVSAGTGDSWYIHDNMRGTGASSGPQLFPNLSAAEANYHPVTFNATGFQMTGYPYPANCTYIYIAIRRGPMKVPTSGTSVFAPVASNASTGTTLTTNFPVDLQMAALRPGNASNTTFSTRLTGINSQNTAVLTPYLVSSSTNAETTGSVTRYWINDSFQMPGAFAGTDTIFWNFQRAPSFFDEVCYTTPGSTFQVVTHNLGVTPELIIVKQRNNTNDWGVQYVPFGSNSAFYLNTADAVGAGGWSYFFTSVTASSITATTSVSGYAAGTYVAYLFATCAGVSKVGSFTGNGTSQTIPCGFTSGARFVLIKKSSGTGDWMVSDSARGIVAGSDPYLELNNTNAEVAGEDWLDTDSTGFVVNEVSGSNANTSGATYIFLAIA